MRRPRTRWLCPLALAAALGAAPAAAAADDPPPIADVVLADAAGKRFAFLDLKGKKAVVVVFLSFECPVATSYAPTLAELSRRYGPQGVAFVGVDSSDELNTAQVARQASDLKIPFPVLKDAGRRAADALRATTSPEAYVLDAGLATRYRGRIDDTYAARLKKNPAVTRHDLREALEEVLAGNPVTVRETRPVGCPIPRDEALPPARADVTYYRDVLPILQTHCQQCHRAGEVGPFALTTYKQAARWSEEIKEFTQARKMPPWKPVAGPGFHNERRLSEKDLATLAAWVDGGRPEGDPRDAPPPPRFVDGWQLGTPDLVLTVPEEMTVGASGGDLFRCFVLPTGLAEDRYVAAIEVRPGNKRAVHHALLFVDGDGQGRRLESKERDRPKAADEPDRGPGYSVPMGVGFRPQGGLGGWAPGQMARTLPDGTGYFLPKGADVVMQVHYHRTGREEKDRTSVGLYFATKPVARRFQSLVVPGWFLMIPPGFERFRVRGSVEVLDDCTLHSVMPHMHMLGREVTVTLTPPGGKPTTLVAIKDWDYNWQETYTFKEPVPVKAGTRVGVEAFYDNSRRAPASEGGLPRPVFFGEQTTDEMCYVFLGATSDKPGRIRVRDEVRRPAPRKKPEEGPAKP
jgi:peroxiredoxin